MKKIISFIILSMLFLCISSPSYAQFEFVKFGNSHNADFWGTADVYFAPFPSALQFLGQRGKTQIVPEGLDLNDENVEEVFNGVYGSFDAIVISEEIGDDLDDDSYEMFRQYVSEGGCVVVTGDHAEDEDTFLNNAFGYDIGVVVLATTPPLPSASRQAAASGTAFAGGPTNLVSADLTTAYTNTPGESIYVGSEGDYLFTSDFGAGKIAAIGFDYCCTQEGDGGDQGFVNTEQQILDWYDVVDRAFNNCSPRVNAVPTLSEWGLIAMASILGVAGFIVIRRRKVTA